MFGKSFSHVLIDFDYLKCFQVDISQVDFLIQLNQKKSLRKIERKNF